MRIAVLGTRGFPGVQGGIEKHCEQLYPRLVKKGAEVTVFARKGYVADRPSDYQGVRLIPLWAPRKKSLEALLHTLFGLFHISLRGHAFDLIHIHAIGPALATPLARLLGKKVVVTHHGPDYERQKWGRFAKQMLQLGERLAARYASAIIAVSKPTQELMERKHGRDSHFVPNGVTLPELVGPGPTAERYGLAPRKYVLGVGRFVPEKGFEDLLSAYRQVKTDWRLAIVGEADHETAHSRGLRELACQDPRVVLTGFLTGAPLGEVYANAGLFVLPSYHEGLPIVLLEAMSYGLPVLVSDIAANTAVIEDRSRQFHTGDREHLRARLEELLAQPSLTAEEQERRRAWVAETFDWDQIAQRTWDIYRSVVQG